MSTVLQDCRFRSDAIVQRTRAVNSRQITKVVLHCVLMHYFLGTIDVPFQEIHEVAADAIAIVINSSIYLQHVLSHWRTRTFVELSHFHSYICTWSVILHIGVEVIVVFMKTLV